MGVQTAPAFLTPREVASLLRGNRETVYAPSRTGTIPAVGARMQLELVNDGPVTIVLDA